MLHLFLTRCGYNVLGCVSPEPPEILGRPSDLEWLGNDESLATQSENGIRLVNGIGSVGSTKVRMIAFIRAISAGASFLDYFHPSAIVDEEITTGDGLQILAGAIVQPGGRIGRNVLVNTGAVLEHNVSVGDHAHIGPRSCLCGDVRVDFAAHIGAGAVVMQGRTVGSRAVVGAGAIVLNDVPSDTTVVGNPARAIVGREI
jgi:UDP-perosamine 4-acetyltransferase